MRLLFLSILMAFGPCFVFAAAEDTHILGTQEKQSKLVNCSELEGVMTDLHIQKIEIEGERDFRVYYYPSCSLDGLVSNTIDDYCSIESNIVAIHRLYMERCEGVLIHK